MPHLTLSEAEKEVRTALEGYDWIKEILDERVFSVYSVLSAQLKEGDRLRLDISTVTKEISYSSFNSPLLKIVLLEKGGVERRVAVFDCLGSITPSENQLYTSEQKGC